MNCKWSGNLARDSRLLLKILLTQYGKIYKPDMRNPLLIENRLQGKLVVGVNSFQQLSCPVPHALKDFIRRELQEIRAAHNAILPPGYNYSRQLYKSFHIDPTKHRPSSEALWRRFRGRDDFQQVNSNSFSLAARSSLLLHEIHLQKGTT